MVKAIPSSMSRSLSFAVRNKGWGRGDGIGKWRKDRNRIRGVGLLKKLGNLVFFLLG